MDGNFEQPALLNREHFWRSGHRLRVEGAAAHDAQLPGLFRDEHVAVRQERHAPRRREPLEHRGDADRRANRFDDLRRVGKRQRRRTLESSRRWSLSSSALSPSCGRLSAAGGG